ncbi:PLD nuclease N-terminal domain-containing protein [Cellulomonas citrea]|uniref:PLD nuclease N-terminal domain-containing protein n=1 Tax=Cellulomonas citrea TaxID=1909423 RepID=UPI001356A62E|nr:PLD nuclease N-terminal domain-containing protein [Cellulomonas citrea]
MLRNLAVLLAIGLVVYAAFDAARSSDEERHGVPAALWVVLILVFPVVGAVIWLLTSRAVVSTQGRRGPTAPDDDPDFLRSLDDRPRPPHGGPGEGGTPGA